MAEQSGSDEVPKMTYARLGKTGLEVSRVCLGMMSYGSSKWAPWVLEPEESLPLIKYAWDRGINFWDTANVYSNGDSERVCAAAIKKYNIPRERLVLATKVNGRVYDGQPEKRNFEKQTANAPLDDVNRGGLSRKTIMQEVEASLKRLETDYIDLYQIHRWDYNTPIEETMRTLDDLVRSGKVRYIGASSMWAWQFSKAQYTAKLNGWTPFVSMQNLHNLLYREEERDMMPLCQDWGVGVIPWSPLAAGLLGGLNRNTVREKTNMFARMLEMPDVNAIIDAVEKIAGERKTKPATIAIAWELSKPWMTSPIVGCSKTSYIDDAVKATAIQLTAEEIKSLEEPYKPKAVVGFT
ncbi:NADP-dependent oxidoreductase domain-containing protein [Hyaloraphidium curvatum]|nr:NADP-dependent oxidoreductase domain-containing protein [Hyaloraphidium curvatum]